MKKEKKIICSECGKQLKSGKDLFVYVDGNNIAITKHSKEMCKECYVKKYGNNK